MTLELVNIFLLNNEISEETIDMSRKEEGRVWVAPSLLGEYRNTEKISKLSASWFLLFVRRNNYYTGAHSKHMQNIVPKI